MSMRASSAEFIAHSEKSLNAVRAAHPAYEISVTGLSVIAARNSGSMIERLNQRINDRDRFRGGFHRAGIPLVDRHAGGEYCRRFSPS